MAWLRTLEHLLLIFGAMMLGLYLMAHLHRATLSQAELQRFKSQDAASAYRNLPVALTTGHPDFGLWSAQRIKDYQLSLAAHFAPAIALLEIPKIHLEVPVLEGTDELSLNRGVGHVSGTAGPKEDGNMAIAGHRDSFFRGLKDVDLGDTVEMVTPRGTRAYVVDRIVIVDPDDISVLQPRSRESLTLVTCYPFYFVGSAPKRYIVQASVVNSAAVDVISDGQPKATNIELQSAAR